MQEFFCFHPVCSIGKIAWKRLDRVSEQERGQGAACGPGGPPYYYYGGIRAFRVCQARVCAEEQCARRQKFSDVFGWQGLPKGVTIVP
jgi:hypothetical protein